MPGSDHARRPVPPPPPRYARGWCPRCQHYLEAQWTNGRVPDYLVCRACALSCAVLSSGRVSLRGGHAATLVWEDVP